MLVPAREIVITSRVPGVTKNPMGDPFTKDEFLTVECEGCVIGWGAAGRADKVKKAIDDHKRQYHSQGTMKILLNPQRG